MNREIESQRAWEAAVKAAKEGNRPLVIWPRDMDRIRIEDLPVLPDGWAASLRGRAWDVHMVKTEKELKEIIVLGHGYALGSALPDLDGNYMIVETW